MHRAAILLLLALFAAPLFSQTLAQAPDGSRNAPAATPGTQNSASIADSAAGDEIPAGTQIHAALDTPLSTKTSKPGDRFTATLTDSVRGSNGFMVLASGARVEGEVAEADEGKMSAALRGKGKLSLRFRDIVSPSGQTIPLTATLISVNDTNGSNATKMNREGQEMPSARKKDVIAGGVGTGAGSERASGLVFGHPLKGLAVGTMAGGGYVLATRSREVNLPAQTGMVIRLDQPVSSAGNNNPMQR